MSVRPSVCMFVRFLYALFERMAGWSCTINFGAGKEVSEKTENYRLLLIGSRLLYSMQH